MDSIKSFQPINYRVFNAITGQELMLRNNKHVQWGNAILHEEDYIEELTFRNKLNAFDCIIDFCQSGDIAQIVNTKNNNTITVSL